MTGQLSQGEIVSWECPSNVSVERLREGVAAAGFDGSVVRDMLPRNAFARAAGKLKENRVITQTGETDEFLYFQLTKSIVDDRAHEADFYREAVLRLSKDSGNIVVHSAMHLDDSEKATLVAHVAKLMGDEIGTRTAQDITRMVKSVFEKKSSDLVTVKDGGGVYFVPAGQLELVDQTQLLFETIGGKVRRFVIGVSEKSSASVADSMADHLTRLVVEFRKSCEDVEPSTSAAVIKRRRETHQKLKAKLDAFRELLAGHHESVTGALADAKQELESRRSGSVPAAPVARTESVAAPVPMSF